MSGSCWLRLAVRIFLNFQRFILMRSHLFSLPSLARVPLPLCLPFSLFVAFYSNELNEQISNAIQQLLKLTRFNEICLLINCSRVQLAKRSNGASSVCLLNRYLAGRCKFQGKSFGQPLETHALASLGCPFASIKRCANKEIIKSNIAHTPHKPINFSESTNWLAFSICGRKTHALIMIDAAAKRVQRTE